MDNSAFHILIIYGKKNKHSELSMCKSIEQRHVFVCRNSVKEPASTFSISLLGEQLHAVYSSPWRNRNGWLGVKHQVTTAAVYSATPLQQIEQAHMYILTFPSLCLLEKLCHFPCRLPCDVRAVRLWNQIHQHLCAHCKSQIPGAIITPSFWLWVRSWQRCSCSCCSLPSPFHFLRAFTSSNYWVLGLFLDRNSERCFRSKQWKVFLGPFKARLLFFLCCFFLLSPAKSAATAFAGKVNPDEMNQNVERKYEVDSNECPK